MDGDGSLVDEKQAFRAMRETKTKYQQKAIQGSFVDHSYDYTNDLIDEKCRWRWTQRLYNI